MHEDNFFSGCLREDTKCKVVDMEEMRKKTKEEEAKRGKREVEGRRHAVNGCVLVLFQSF